MRQAKPLQLDLGSKDPGTQRWKIEGERTEALAGTGTLEASTPSKPFLLRVLRLRQSQLGGWSRAAERLTIGQVTEAARREGGLSRFCCRIPSPASLTAGRDRGTAGWKAVSPAAQDWGLKAIRAGTLVRAKQALHAAVLIYQYLSPGVPPPLPTEGHHCFSGTDHR